MADVEDDQQARDDLLKWMQMEALGIKRREKITTADFIENSKPFHIPVSIVSETDCFHQGDFTTVSQLEGMRKALGGDYRPAKQGQTKIVGWQSTHSSMSLRRQLTKFIPDIYRVIQDDGSASPGDLSSVNEGLGQTHRAKLMEDDSVRAYTGESTYRRGRTHHGSSR